MTALAPTKPPLPPQLARAPIARGALGALLGYGVGVGLVAIVRTAIGDDAWQTDISWTFGYIAALIGWLLGVGAWTHWGREFVGLDARPYTLSGPRRYFGFSPDHKLIGIQYIVTFAVVLLLAGLTAMLIRVELADSGTQLIGGDDYNAVMSFHGITMVAVAVAMFLGGLGNYVVPLMIGARDMAFPRLNALSYWLVPPIVVMLLISLLAYSGWNNGWTAYPPLSVLNGSEQTLFNLAIITFGLVSILGGINSSPRSSGNGRPDEPHAHAHLRLGRAGRLTAGLLLHPGLRRGAADDPPGPHGPHVVLQRGCRIERDPLRARLLVLLPPRRLRDGAAGFRRGAGDPLSLLSQTRLRLPLGAGRLPRHRRAGRGRLGAPHVHQRHEQQRAGPLPDHHGDDLHPHRSRLPVRHRHRPPPGGGASSGCARPCCLRSPSSSTSSSAG